MISIGLELSLTATQILESYQSADPVQERLTSMKAQEFDQIFDDGEDIIEYLDLSQAKRSRSDRKTVSIDLPIWIVESIDREAIRLGVTQQSIIQTSLTEHFAVHSPS
jgi:hypothetical protein